MAVSRYVLKTVGGIDRPAIATVMPNQRDGYTTVLDLGANVDCTRRAPAAVRGHGQRARRRGRRQGRADGRPAQHRRRGDQGQRGDQAGGRAAARGGGGRHRQLPRQRRGQRHLQGHDRHRRLRRLRRQRRAEDRRGPGVDADRASSRRSSRATRSPSWPRLPRCRCSSASRRRVDHRRYNGAALLGLRGLVFKSHGSADAFAFEQALNRAHDAAQQRPARARRATASARRSRRCRPRPAGRATTARSRRPRRSAELSPHDDAAAALFAHHRHRQLSCRPDGVSNADLAARLAKDGIETSDEWIVERTGIRFRHFAAPDVACSDLARASPRGARSRPPTATRSAIDLIIVATSTPDMVFPSAACMVQEKLGIARLRRVRRAGGLLGLRLRARDRRRDDQDRQATEGAGDRRRSVLAHPRLQRPHHLRPVRRRRRRGRPRGERDARHPRERAACRRPPRRHPVRAGHGLGRQDPRRSAAEDGRPGGVQARRRRARERRPLGARQGRPHRRPTSTG